MYFYPDSGFCKKWNSLVKPTYWCAAWLRGADEIEA